ncbi:MAG TPA: D-2-hydroxyacid dehydrogenase [Stellaceae bacterium]|nr:D-2-hydroxyacid dehydrogenase [Stellaceae bacterium]
MSKTRIFIASPLEPEHVERIRAVDPARVDVDYAPDLLPPTRYIGDHVGVPFKRTEEQQSRWRGSLGQAEVMWDVPRNVEELALTRRLRWVQMTSTGVGQLMKNLGLRSDVLVTTARGVHAAPLGEFVFMVLLAQWRGLSHLQAEQRAHRWTRYCGEGVARRRLVVIGAGDLARGLAERARAFGMTTVAIARDTDKSRAHDGLFAEIRPRRDLHAVLASADAVVVTVPHTPETENMIDRAAFAAMKPGVVFVNIARGQVIDEAALLDGLRNGRIGFAALDVATTEPLPPESPFWDLPNVLISPHSASTVVGENAAIIDIFCWNLRCWLDGRLGEMRNVLDKERMY